MRAPATFAAIVGLLTVVVPLSAGQPPPDPDRVELDRLKSALLRLHPAAEAGQKIRAWTAQSPSFDKLPAALDELGLAWVRVTGDDAIRIERNAGKLTPAAGMRWPLVVIARNRAGAAAPLRVRLSGDGLNLDTRELEAAPGRMRLAVVSVSSNQPGNRTLVIAAAMPPGEVGTSLDLNFVTPATLRVNVRERDGGPVDAWLNAWDELLWQRFEPRAGFTGWGAQRAEWMTHGSEARWYVGPTATLLVPPGKLRIMAGRSLEHVPQSQALDLAPGATGDAEFALPRWIDLPARGWYSLDTHMHFTAVTDERLAGLMRMFAIEGLNAAPLMDWAGRAPGGRAEFWWEPRFIPMERREGDTLLFFAQDWAPSGSCYLKLLGHKTPISGQSRYSQASIIRHVQAEGGIAVHSAFGPLYTEAAILGDIVATESFVWDELRDDRLRIWYDLLNVGCRLAILAGTDVQKSAEPGLISGFMPAGANRAYVHCGDSFDKGSLLKAIAAGRTFVTNGPALLLEVNGQMPGAPIALERQGTVRVSVELVCPAPLGGFVELIVNGQVVQRLELAPGENSLRHVGDLPVAEGSWIAARYRGAERFPAQAMPLAHTSPIYVSVAGRGPWNEESFAPVAGRIAREDVIQASDATDAEKALSADFARRARELLNDRRSSAPPPTP